MPTTKYSEPIVDAILKVVRLTGDYVAAYRPHISKATYYKWLKDYPEFKEKIEDGLEHWRKTQTDELVILSRQWFLKLLTEGNVSISQVEQVTTDPNGKPWRTVKRIKTVSPPPRWLFDRVLGEATLNLGGRSAEPIEIQWIDADRFDEPGLVPTDAKN